MLYDGTLARNEVNEEGKSLAWTFPLVLQLLRSERSDPPVTKHLYIVYCEHLVCKRSESSKHRLVLGLRHKTKSTSITGDLRIILTILKALGGGGQPPYWQYQRYISAWFDLRQPKSDRYKLG